MKKKSFFNGFNAKLALAVVALTGSLLTGCYKDEGLDIIDPDQIGLPAATYTLVGTVVNGNGELVSDATVTVSPNTTFKQNGASFTAAVAPGDVKITVTPKADAGYKGVVEKTVRVEKVNAGQSAVYTETIVLAKVDEPVVEKVDAKYNVKVSAFASNDLSTKLNAADYSVTLTNGKGEKITPTNGEYVDLAYGIYNVVVTPTDATKFEAYTSSLTLSQVKVAPDTDNLNAEVYAVLVVKSEEKPEKEYKILSAFVDVDDSDNLVVTNLKLTKDDATIAESQSNYIIYLDQYIKGETHVYKLYVNYKDNGLAKTKTLTYGAEVSSLSVVLVANQSSIEVNDGKVEENIEAPIDDSTTMEVEKGTEIELNGKSYSGTFDVVSTFYQNSEPTTIRSFEGTPDGLVFKNNPLKISFKDAWGGDLGALNLLYMKKDGQWFSDGTGSVEKIGESYVMNVEHFSHFKAEVSIKDTTIVTTPKKSVVVTPVKNGMNDNPTEIQERFEYIEKYGNEVSDVNEAVRKAGFKNENAVGYVSNIISQLLNDLGYYIGDYYEQPADTYITIPAWSCLDSVTRTTQTSVIEVKVTIAGKEVVVNITNWNGNSVFTPEIATFGHGHGHSHGHGQGNAGGGIIEAE